jgi:pimeloyl-ACP methyl ester carboxylesterase
VRITAHHLLVDGRVGFIQEVEPDHPNGQCLVLLHTAGQSGVQWRNTLRPLSERGYRLVVPDLPGHGHSEPAANGPIYNLSEYATWLISVFDALKVVRPIVVGCSIGGKIAQELAVVEGSRLRAVISMCAEPGRGRADAQALERDLEDIAAASRTDRTHLGTRAVLGRKVSKERTALIARMHCREDPVVTTNDLIGWATHDITSKLPDVVCPATFVAGEDDLWASSSAIERASKLVPDGTYVLLEGCGHYPMEEMDRFAVELDGWIDEMISRNSDDAAAIA